jgi:hypothetical protein
MDEFVDEFDWIGRTLTTPMEFTSSMELNEIWQNGWKSYLDIEIKG